MIEQHAYAKINLTLEVIGRRSDRYHDIISVVQLVDLHDTLIFSPADQLVIECDEPALAIQAQHNLVWRAARLLQEIGGVNGGARIRLHKRIPVAAGLGGGSSDAAATLVGLARLWELDLPRWRLWELAAQLGSDVPLFFHGPTALVEGRGERVTRVPTPPPGWAVLVCPSYNIPDKTRRLYESLHPHDYTEGSITRRLVSALVAGQFPSPELLYNAFDRAAAEVFQSLNSLREAIHRIGGRDAHLSGSGPTLYVLYSSAEQAQAEVLYRNLQASGVPVFLTRLLSTVQGGI
jgi:4-diphosphocytidyl-2-C-methyl-D-erythritol kinase